MKNFYLLVDHMPRYIRCHGALISTCILQVSSDLQSFGMIHKYCSFPSCCNVTDIETKIFDGEISTHDFAIANRSYLTYFSNKDFMFDNDEFLIVVAAGNIGEGNNYNTVGEPGASFAFGILSTN